MDVTFPRPIDAASLHALIVAGGELALLDVREDNAHAFGHHVPFIDRYILN